MCNIKAFEIHKSVKLTLNNKDLFAAMNDMLSANWKNEEEKI